MHIFSLAKFQRAEFKVLSVRQRKFGDEVFDEDSNRFFRGIHGLREFRVEHFVGVERERFAFDRGSNTWIGSLLADVAHYLPAHRNIEQ